MFKFIYNITFEQDIMITNIKRYYMTVRKKKIGHFTETYSLVYPNQ